MPTVLHVAPHPDDEVVGAPCTLLRLVEQGWSVVNLAISLGRAADRRRRRDELAEASRRIGFETVIADPLIDISSSADRAAAITDVQRAVASVIGSRGASLVVAPSPHDGHHGHEIVGHGAWRAAASSGARLWLWGVWAELARPSLLVPVDRRGLEAAAHALEAHAGELDRNDYRDLIEARARIHAILGPERIWGFGAPGRPHRWCEVLMDVAFLPEQPAGRGIAVVVPFLSAPREFDTSEPAPFVPGPSLRGWITARSDRAVIAAAERVRSPS